MTRFLRLLLRLFLASILLPHYIECAVRLWVPFGSAESKPAPAVPYGVDVNKAEALTKEFTSNESITTAYQAYSSSDNVHLREKCGETPSIPTYDRAIGNVTPTVVEPGLQWSAVLISNDGKYRCGATFISRRHLITAGSCFRNPLAAGTREGVVGLGLYWTISCRFLIGDMYKEACERRALYKKYRLKMAGAAYVFDQSKEYLQSTRSYLEDIAIIEVNNTNNFKRTDVRPACVPSRNDTFTHKNAFTFALLQSEADVLTAGKYAKQPVLLGSASLNDSDRWHTAGESTPPEWLQHIVLASAIQIYLSYEALPNRLACNATGIMCVTIPYRSKKPDFWILPGVGVFDGVEGSDKWHLYGYVLEVVPDDEHRHYHVVIRLVQGLLTTLCYFAGVCTDEAFNVPPSRSSVEAFLNMAYDPSLHNGTEMWKSLTRDNSGEEYSDYGSQFSGSYVDNPTDHFNIVADDGAGKHYHNHKKHDGRIVDNVEL